MRWILPFIISLSSVAQAQHPFPIRHLTTRDGLSQGSCTHILKDSRGFVWASSQNGLNRFDGSRFTTYRFDEADSTTIGKGELHGIVETSVGDLWVGTEDCLSQYVRRTDSFKRYYANDHRGQRTFTGHEPFYADDSTVWFSNNLEGVVRFNYRTGRRTVVNRSILPKSTISTEWIYYLPKEQALVYLLPLGFAKYHWPTKRLTTYCTGQASDVLPGHEMFKCLYRTRSGHFCLGSSTGIYEYDATLTRLIRHHPLRPGIETYRFEGIVEDKQGLWWLAVEGAGVWLYDPVNQRILREIGPGLDERHSLLTNQISELYVDDIGLVWVSSDPFGIDVIYPNTNTIRTFSDDRTDETDLNHHPIRGLYEDQQHRIWIGTVDGGIRRLDPVTGTMRAYTAEQGVQTEGNVRQIYETRSGRLLVANLQGLQQYDPVKDRFTVLPNPLCKDDTKCQYARGIIELPDGRFAVATYAGIFLYDADLWVRSCTDANSAYFGSLYYDPATQLLYAGRDDQDLVVYSYRDGQLTMQYSALPAHNVMYFHLDQARRCLWLCTDRGLVRFDPATRRALRTYTIRDDLPDDVVYTLLPDQKGRFWLSTNNGLAKFYPDREKFTPVVATQGREYNSLAALIGSDGTFYFGGVHGLDRFVPEQLDYQATIPVRIVDFRVDNKPYRDNGFVGETGQANLTYQHRTFSIGFAALDYFSDGKYEFLYQLVGVDKEWMSLSDANFVQYADVAPGDYTFYVRAIDARGQPTGTTTLRIVINPPFWRTWWFIVLCLVLLIGFVAFGVNAYNRRKLVRQRRLLRNTLATQESERRRIAQDLHDDVGNTLAAIKGMLGQACERIVVQAELPEVIQAYELIDKASNDLRAITHDLMPIEFEKYALPDVVAQLIDRVNRSSRIHFEYILFGEVRRLKPERELVTYRIVAELIQNALKHGGSGLGIVQLGYHPRYLSILIETPLSNKDTKMQNFNNLLSNVPQGIGQKNISYRAEYLNATLAIDRNEQSHIAMLDVPYDSTGYHTYQRIDN